LTRHDPPRCQEMRGRAVTTKRQSVEGVSLHRIVTRVVLWTQMIGTNRPERVTTSRNIGRGGP